MMLEDIIFYILATIAVVSALLVVVGKSPVTNALALVANFFCIAFLYLLMEAQFMAIIQIMVYAGAIIVLFLFTIMLLNLQEDITIAENFDLKKGFAVLLSGLFLVQMIYVIHSFIETSDPASLTDSSFVEMGTVEAIGKALFTDFVLPFELITVVLLSAVVGAIVVAKRKVDE